MEKTLQIQMMEKVFNCTKITTSIMKGGNAMDYFLAVNDRQLGTCLRMLFAEKLQPAVQTVLNDKGKIEFHISIAADREVFDELDERYKILIS